MSFTGLNPHKSSSLSARLTWRANKSYIYNVYIHALLLIYAVNSNQNQTLLYICVHGLNIYMFHSTASHFRDTDHFERSDPKMTLITTKSKTSNMRSNNNPASQISLNFTLRLATSKTFANFHKFLIAKFQEVTFVWTAADNIYKKFR